MQSIFLTHQAKEIAWIAQSHFCHVAFQEFVRLGHVCYQIDLLSRKFWLIISVLICLVNLLVSHLMKHHLGSEAAIVCADNSLQVEFVSQVFLVELLGWRRYGLALIRILSILNHHIIDIIWQSHDPFLLLLIVNPLIHIHFAFILSILCIRRRDNKLSHVTQLSFILLSILCLRFYIQFT